jgi:hypothetical protein
MELNKPEPVSSRAPMLMVSQRRDSQRLRSAWLGHVISPFFVDRFLQSRWRRGCDAIPLAPQELVVKGEDSGLKLSVRRSIH